jgi:cyclic-di-GMP-binding protein
MPSFDVSAEMNWQELDNAVNQALKESAQRYDFKGVKVELKIDLKAKTVTMWCSEEGKLDALKDILHSKLVKRGISLLALEYGDKEEAFGGSVRQVITVQAGISKEKGKEVMAELKESKLKVQSQLQDEKVRVTGKNRDDLQLAIAHLRANADRLKIAMQFGNFRD